MKTEQQKNQFEHYGLSTPILEALDLFGYKNPTAIQAEVIPAILEGKCVVAKAPTGSGKTAAFGIPICEMVAWEENAPQALILEPTRELAVQVSDEVFHIARKKRLKVPAVFGGFDIDKQIRTIRQKSHIVVGTPGRVLDLANRDELKFEKMRYIVIDEADLMMDMGFMEDVKKILSLVPEDSKLSLFSATLKPEIQSLADEFIPEKTIIKQDWEEGTETAIMQELYETASEEKYKAFRTLLIKENPDCCMIFCGTREMVNVLFRKMRKDRIFCGMLHGEIDQMERLKTIGAFRKGGFRYLIATDVAARGIDLDHITHVFNYDFPTGRETYVHRIGRTGRNGKKGKALSLVCEDDMRMLDMVREYTGKKMPLLPCPVCTEAEEKIFWKAQRQKPELRPDKGAALNREITRLSVGGGRKSKLRAGDIVGAVCSIEGLVVEDIGVIDIRDSLTYVEILNGKGSFVLDGLQERSIKGKVRKVRLTKK